MFRLEAVRVFANGTNVKPTRLSEVQNDRWQAMIVTEWRAPPNPRIGLFEKKIKMMLQGLGVVLICPSASEKQRLKQGSARREKRLTLPENQKRSFRKQKQQSEAKAEQCC